MSKEEYAVEVENISKIYTLRNKNNQYKKRRCGWNSWN